jgi:ABC-type multidrug transport system permease subunit
MMWIMAVMGMLVRNAETTQVGTMVITFPLVFVSSAFVPVETMPKWLQVLADINPVTVTVDAIRCLLVSGHYTTTLWQAFIWIVGLLIVFIPLAINRYQHSV